MKKYLEIIRKDKKTRFMTIFIMLIMFIFAVGYSLAYFDMSSSNKIANVKVNDLSFNITTNSGESDDRILHLQAGKIEKFNINLTNLNNIDVKYELIYELCNDSNCTSSSEDIPNDLVIYRRSNNTKVSGSLKSKKNYNMTIVTKNDSTNDYYIKLNLHAGYVWNDLELASQFKTVSPTIDTMNIISYVDGVEVTSLPTSCSYKVTMKAFNNDTEVTSDSLNLTCNYYTNKWSINFSELDVLPDTIKLNFTSIDVPSDALIKEFDYVKPTTDYPEPYYIYEAPIDGVYKLETWGAQGGFGKKNGNRGGFGGYSTGNINLSKGDKLYIYVGGQGATSSNNVNGLTAAGGYNGGGTGTSTTGKYGSGGGGATHIALQSGLLSTLENNKDKIIIVSGGGGAGFNHLKDELSTIGSSAGGYIGGGPLPGTQTLAGGSGAFGKGASNGGASAGGAGYYGGGSCSDSKSCSGGSSYIGNSLLTDKAMYCYGCEASFDSSTYTINTLGIDETLDKTNCSDGYSSSPVSKCAKSGNGYAKITFINDAS